MFYGIILKSTDASNLVTLHISPLFVNNQKLFLYSDTPQVIINIHEESMFDWICLGSWGHINWEILTKKDCFIRLVESTWCFLADVKQNNCCYVSSFTI